MKYYIVDDMIGIVKAIENIIESRDIGEVIGFQTNPEKAMDEILLKRPDIVLVDLLMPTLDGIGLVKKVRSVTDSISFVMISKVTDKDMVEQAYDVGIEFFIHKPINIKEIETVLGNVAEKRHINSLIENIRGVFKDDKLTGERSEEQAEKMGNSLGEINLFLGFLGMNGEKGTADIIDLCRLLCESGESFNKTVLQKMADQKGDSSKNIEQRMRRAMKKGLTNVASIGLSDYGNDIFQVYGNYVFDFRSIRDEMDCLEGKNPIGGRINLSKFIDGLLLYKNSKNV